MKKIFLIGCLAAGALFAKTVVTGEVYPVEGVYDVNGSSYVTVRDREGAGADYLASRHVPKDVRKKLQDGYPCYAIIDNNISILVTCEKVMR